MDWKAEQEWIIMRYFMEYCPGFPKGKLVKSESPDFQLWISPKRFIGIELTQIHQPNSDRPVQCFLGSESPVQQLSHSVHLKEEKVRLYRSDHPYKLWLIIFADYSEPRAKEKLTKTLLHNKLITQFDRVCFFDLANRSILTLK